MLLRTQRDMCLLLITVIRTRKDKYDSIPHRFLYLIYSLRVKRGVLVRWCVSALRTRLSMSKVGTLRARQLK
jgi:hypothetical protein